MLTLDRLLAEVGLELATGPVAAATAVRWVHSTELMDPTPWLTGGEPLLTTGIQFDTEARQRPRRPSGAFAGSSRQRRSCGCSCAGRSAASASIRPSAA